MSLIKNASVDITTYFVLRDSTTHAPRLDVTVTDIDLYYVKQRTVISAKIDCTALAAADSAHSDGGAFHVGQGLYRIDWPDAAFNGGNGTKCTLIVVCTGVDVTFLDIELNAQVQTAYIETGAITATSIAANAFAAAKFAADAITAIQTGAVLAGTQPAITWAQQKILASVSGEGALHIANAHGSGEGLHTEGGDVGQANYGAIGQYNEGDGTGGAGTYNRATGASGYGLRLGAEGVGGTGLSAYGLGGDVDPAWAEAATALSNLVWTDTKAGYLAGAVALEATLTAIKGAGWTTETLAAIDAVIDAVKAKTDLIPASPAATGDIPTAAQNADAVWDEALSGHAGVGTAGAALSGASAPTAGQVADAVWDEALAGHVGAGSAGAGLAAAGSAGDPWGTTLPGSYTGDQAGAKLAAIKAKTDLITASTPVYITAPPSQQTPYVKEFGIAFAGLTTVGYELRNVDDTVHQARTTVGVYEVGTNTGVYAVARHPQFVGTIVWDTGGDSPFYSGDAVGNEQEMINALYASGVGPRVATITVVGLGSPLQGATVRMSNGGEVYRQLTDASGVATFALSDGSWTLAVGLLGWMHTPTTVSVEDDVAETATMTRVAYPTPDLPNQSVGALLVLDENGAPRPWTAVVFEMTALPTDFDGYAADSGEFIRTSGEDGYLYVSLIQGATYRHRWGKGSWSETYVVPDEPFALPGVSGYD